MHQLNATEQKWFSLIQEAISSGLSDKAWCLQNSIPLSTFYYNIRRLRNKVAGLPACRSTVIPEDHEIVKLEKAREHKEWRLEYMTLLERDEMMREEGRKEERVNTLREKQRADSAEQRADSAEQRADSAEQRAADLEQEIARLREQLAAGGN